MCACCVCITITSHFLSNTGDKVKDVNGLQQYNCVFFAGVQVNIKVCPTVMSVFSVIYL